MGNEDRKQGVVHRNLAVIEVADPSLIDRLFHDPRVRPLLWLRIGETRVLIAPDKVSAVARALDAAGVPAHYSRELSRHGEST